MSLKTGGYGFHGKDIVRAVIDDIIAEKTNIVDIAMLGTSAGAFGVQSNCDLIDDKFKEEKNDLDVRCIADSGDLVPPVGDECTTVEPAVKYVEFYGGELDATCTGSVKECVRFSSPYNFIETSFISTFTR